MRDAITYHFAGNLVVVEVLLPHLDEVIRTDDYRKVAMLLAEHHRDSTCRDRLPEADDVTEHSPATRHDAPSEGPHGGRLIVEKLLLDFLRHRILVKAFSNVAG